jgi:hypothetical protein
MRSTLKQRLLAILRWFAKIFVEQIFRVAIISLLTFLPFSFLIESLRTTIWGGVDHVLRIAFLTPPREWQLQSILLVSSSLILLFAAFHVALNRIKKRSKRDYFFLRTHGLKWKVNKYTGEVERTPYCRNHQVQLLATSNYYICSKCGSSLTKFTPFSDVELTYKLVVPIARAKVEGHLK